MAFERAFNSPFQHLTADEEAWLNIWRHEGAKELVVEAIQFCIGLVSPASTSPPARALTETDIGEFLRRWGGVSYGGTTVKIAMDANVRTAREIAGRWNSIGSEGGLRPIADSFLDAARKEYQKLTADGMPDGFRPWRRLLAESAPE